MPDRLLHGVIAATVTPLDNTGERVDLAAARALTAALVERGVHGLFILGTTGEGLLLSREERQAVLEAVLPAAQGVPVAVHVGALTTATACDLARHAARVGAAAVAAIPPSYYAVTRGELLAHYRAIAAAAAQVPVYLYNIPSHARNDVTPELVHDLRAAIPAVAGIKDSTGEPGRVQRLLEAGGPGFAVINGSDELDLAALQGGAQGIVASGAGLFPELYLALYAAWREQRLADAEAAQRRIVAMQQTLGNGTRLGWYKEVWRLRGLPLGGVRAPLLPATAEEAERVRAGLASLGLR